MIRRTALSVSRAKRGSRSTHLALYLSRTPHVSCAPFSMIRKTHLTPMCRSHLTFTRFTRVASHAYEVSVNASHTCEGSHTHAERFISRSHLTPGAARARAGMYGFPFLLLTLQVQVISRPARQRHLTLEWAGRISRPTLQPPKWWGRSPNLLTSSWDRRCRRCRSWSRPACAG